MWSKKTIDEDPFLSVARMQRWFIAIHPFRDGNGRVSRFVMDLMVKSLGLPAPILKNVEHDLYFTHEQWAREIGTGIIRAVQEAEACLRSPDNVGCREITELKPGVSL